MVNLDKKRRTQMPRVTGWLFLIFCMDVYREHTNHAPGALKIFQNSSFHKKNKKNTCLYRQTSPYNVCQPKQEAIIILSRKNKRESKPWQTTTIQKSKARPFRNQPEGHEKLLPGVSEKSTGRLFGPEQGHNACGHKRQNST